MSSYSGMHDSFNDGLKNCDECNWMFKELKDGLCDGCNEEKDGDPA